jgi:predicted Rossmann fold flavoprotein
LIWDAVIVGAGAAGIFAALRAKQLEPSFQVLVLEKAPKPLRKVAISGGGRCNVTHDCDDLDFLIGCYPRGGPRLESILTRFMPYDTVDWFQSRGVPLKTEADGRMFPKSNKSQSVIDCLLGEAQRFGVEVRTRVGVTNVAGRSGEFRVQTAQEDLRAKRVLLATGGASKANEWLRAFGHELVEDIPSLFTFCCTHPAIVGLQGLSVERVRLSLQTQPGFESEGPFLITHWGVSGPAVLKLSAFAARVLAELSYRARMQCDLLPHLDSSEVESRVRGLSASGKQVSTLNPFPEIPKRLWQRLLMVAGVGENQHWRKLKDHALVSLTQTLKSLALDIDGKGVFKDEFVTSGGVPLHEIDVYTMESRKAPGVFVAGELLNVDGITGGFNFQNAWASGFVAGEGLVL